MKRIILAVLVELIASIAYAADRPSTRPYTRNVAIVVYDGAEPLDWAGPYEVYHNAAQFGAVGAVPAFNVYIVSKSGQNVNSQGLHVAPNYSIANAPKPDVVLFPGGGTNNILNDPEFFAWAGKIAAGAEISQSVCTGAFVLAKAGLLDDLEVTTWYGAIDRLAEQYPKLTVKNGRRYIDNGRVITTAGISAGIDGSLHVVARLLGRRIADQVARYMEYHWTPESYLAAQYAYLNPSTDDRGRALQLAAMHREEKRFAEAETAYRQLLEQNQDDLAVWEELGGLLYARKQYPASAAAYLRAAAEEGTAARAYYNAACSYALAGDRDRAVETLQQAFAAGFHNRNAALEDPDLASIRNDPRIQQLAAAK